jgi:hypothetical protein
MTILIRLIKFSILKMESEKENEQESILVRVSI